MPSTPLAIYPRISGKNLEAELSLRSADLVPGTEIPIEVHRGGDKPEEVRLKIPKGLKTGSRMKVPGMGLANGDQQPGDLFLTVQILDASGPQIVEPEIVEPDEVSHPVPPVTPSAPPVPTPIAVATPPPISQESAVETPIEPATSIEPSSKVQTWITLCLWICFLAGVAHLIWGKDSNWVKTLDRPTAETKLTYLDGEPVVFPINTNQQSIKGYHKIESVVATLQLDSGGEPVPFEVKDLNGRKWGDNISYETLSALSGTSTPNQPIQLKLQGDLPVTPEMAGQTGTVDLDMTVGFPWFVKGENGEPAFENKSWPIRHSIPIKLVPGNYTPMATYFNRAVVLFILALIPFGIIRANARGKVQVIAAIVLFIIIVAVMLVTATPRKSGQTDKTSSDNKADLNTLAQQAESSKTSEVKKPVALEPLKPAAQWSEAEILDYQIGIMISGNEGENAKPLDLDALDIGISDCFEGRASRLGKLSDEQWAAIEALESNETKPFASTVKAAADNVGSWTVFQQVSYIRGYELVGPTFRWLQMSHRHGMVGVRDGWRKEDEIPQDRKAYVSTAKQTGLDKMLDIKVKGLDLACSEWLKAKESGKNVSKDSAGNIYEIVEVGKGPYPADIAKVKITASIRGADGKLASYFSADGEEPYVLKNEEVEISLSRKAYEQALKVRAQSYGLFDDLDGLNELLYQPLMVEIGKTMRVGEKRRIWLNSCKYLTGDQTKQYGIPLSSGIELEIKLEAITGGTRDAPYLNTYSTASYEDTKQWEDILPLAIDVWEFRAPDLPMYQFSDKEQKLVLTNSWDWSKETTISYKLGLLYVGVTVQGFGLTLPAVDRGLLDALAKRPALVDIAKEQAALKQMAASATQTTLPIGHDWKLPADAASWTSLQKMSYCYGYTEVAQILSSFGLEVTCARLGILHGATLKLDTKRTYPASQLNLRDVKIEDLIKEAIKYRKERADDFFNPKDYIAKSYWGLGDFTKTPTGVYYQILSTGGGPKPKHSDTIRVSYESRVIDGGMHGKAEPNAPQTWAMSALIKGLKETLQEIPVGSRVQLYIPPSQAYGENPVGLDVPCYGVLFYDITIQGIE